MCKLAYYIYFQKQITIVNLGYFSLKKIRKHVF